MQNKNPLLKWYFQSLSRRVKAFEIRAAQKADTLLPITKGDGEYFRQMAGAGHQLVCPAGIDKALLKANTDNDKVCRKGLFFIGALDWGPNQEGLKWFIDKVWPKLQQAEKNRMDIAGRNAPLWLEKRIKASGIHYHGEVENAYAFMGNYQVMLVPLLSGSGLRVKIVEAMAMGKCVVTTSIGAEGTGARHGKELIIADTPGEFARASMRLCSDPALAKKIGNKAREFAHEHFDKEKMRLND
jgi:glycosyltransferase involved in cell wall biosynthesis